MEIEVFTTKKRLTKSILKQMSEPTIEELEKAKCLGFVNVSHSNSQSNLLLQVSLFNYRITGTNWKKQGNTIYKKGVGIFDKKDEKRFKNPKEAERFFELIEAFKRNAEQIYI